MNRIVLGIHLDFTLENREKILGLEESEDLEFAYLGDGSRLYDIEENQPSKYLEGICDEGTVAYPDSEEELRENLLSDGVDVSRLSILFYISLCEIDNSDEPLELLENFFEAIEYARQNIISDGKIYLLKD